MRLVIATLLLTMCTSIANAEDGCAPFAATIRRAVHESGVPGLAVAVVRNDRIVCIATFGMRDLEHSLPVTAQTEFYIASAAKPFTALAAKMLALDGKLSLDAPLTTTLPQLALPAPLDPARMSLRDLMTHRLGFENEAHTWRTAYSGDWTDEVLFDTLRDATVITPRQFKYSNLGYNLLGAALRQATGEEWQSVVAARVFRPAGLTHTYARLSEAPQANVAKPYGYADGRWIAVPPKTDRTMHPAGGFYTSIADLARWVSIHLNEGVIDGQRVFPREAMTEVHAPQVNLAQKFGRIRRFAYGLGWYRGDYNGELLIHHFGSYPGAWAHTSFMPDRKIAIAAVSNAETPLPDSVALYIYDTLLGKSDAEARLAEDTKMIKDHLARLPEQLSALRRKVFEQATDSDRTLDSYAGSYSNTAWGAMTIARRDDALTATMGLLTGRLERVRGDSFLAFWFPGEAPERIIFTSSGLTKDGVKFERQP
jgi:CubicO group peptidase (beta-lactamase class C family)